MHLEGHCLCGAVSYAFDGEPAVTALCHCANCQRQTGTASSLIVGVPANGFSVQGGTLRTFATTGDDHGTNTNRHFCSACGSPIVSRVEAIPDLVFIKGGTLNDTSWLRPTVELWCQSAQPWEPAIPGAQRLDRGPSRAA
ncbi:MAG: hypothetical protein QOK40_3012 [Miltoncostaeaceae bacterium]|nr:hypothetical protein [Miltoncostaeaceae bacterium]